MSIYLDKRGRKWVRVADTRGGVYAWFRPLAHADDGSYDRCLKVAELTSSAS